LAPDKRSEISGVEMDLDTPSGKHCSGKPFNFGHISIERY